MKEYWASDYALNKKSMGIVYRFADGVVEITLEDYLREDPGKTEADFLALKAISDEIYHQQAKAEHAETCRDVPLHTCKGLFAPSAEEIMEAKTTMQDLEQLQTLLENFIASGILTKTQQHRFFLYCIQGLSTRQIATLDGVRQFAVWKSLALCQRKFQKFLEKRVVTPLDFLQ